MKVKKIAAILLAAMLSLNLCGTALAAAQDTGFTDVSADAWYADAVIWCRDHGIMTGTSDTTFGPEESLTRAMLATVLYRAEKEPAVSGAPGFTDTRAGTWYADAVVWADSEKLMQGYGNGAFGTNDPLTREQLATILWRYDGEKDAGSVQFPDSASVSGFARTAVNWAVANGILLRREDGSAAPLENAIRAEVAVALMTYLQSVEAPSQPEPQPEQESKVLVAYFSATGNTKGVAEKIATSLSGADLYEITPAQPYTAADLDYNSDCRANREQNDSEARPEISGTVENMDEYDVIFLGYPIWWGRAPKIIYTFLESYDLAGKTVIPFCTSGSSGYNDSGIRDLVGSDTTWIAGQRFSGGASESTVAAWVNSLDIA